MARGFTRDQAAQNAAFLKALRRSRNIRLAAQQVGLKYGTARSTQKREAPRVEALPDPILN